MKRKRTTVGQIVVPELPWKRPAAGGDVHGVPHELTKRNVGRGYVDFERGMYPSPVDESRRTC